MARNRENAAGAGWQRQLAFPVKLRDGHIMETMAQADDLIAQRLPKQRQTKPDLAADGSMLMTAHSSGLSTGQLCRALAAEG